MSCSGLPGRSTGVGRVDSLPDVFASTASPRGIVRQRDVCVIWVRAVTGLVNVTPEGPGGRSEDVCVFSLYTVLGGKLLVTVSSSSVLVGVSGDVIVRSVCALFVWLPGEVSCCSVTIIGPGILVDFWCRHGYCSDIAGNCLSRENTSQGCRRRQQHKRIRVTSHLRVAKLTEITYGRHIKVDDSTQTRNKREMLPLGNDNIWGRNTDLPQYEMRAYLSRCVVRHP